ncbi:MAG TPA: hypothetical protein VN932_13390 [Rhizomicrobium sp.]|nr:hypothetical protein [Rhizomicrobium sp.]
MRFRTIALGCAFVVASSAAYADDLMANTYGNTVMTKSHKTGASATLLFNQDMTYTARAMDAKGQPVSYGGAWMTKDGGNTICLTPKLPPNAPGAGTSCSPLSKHNVGDSWSVTNDQGETFDVSLSAGR